MPDLANMLSAVAHDPIRRSDRFPFGAVPAGTEVCLALRVTASARPGFHEAWLEVSDPMGDGDDHGAWRRLPMELTDGGFTVAFGTAGEPRVVFYRFLLRTKSGFMAYAPCGDDGLFGSAYPIDGIVTGDDGLPLIDPASGLRGFQLTIYDPVFTVPSWFPGSTMYQIFPDRFARGEAGIRWEGIEAHQRRGWPVLVHEDWDEAPFWEEPYEPVDFFGGTLAGIEEKLDYIASLGVDVIYLNPIWEARSDHRYDTGDYEEVDPVLGKWTDLDSLVEAARARGMRIVLDTVLSHTGAASKYFNADGSYDSLGAAQSPDSPYRSWYQFDPAIVPTGYRCWWGDATLPEVEERDGSWQYEMLGVAQGAMSEDNPGVLGRWVSHGIGGLRLDVADEIPDDVLELIRTSAKSADEQTVVIGEVWEDPTTKESYGSRRTYALGRSLDSVMNYPLRSALIRFANGLDDARQLRLALQSQASNYPQPFYESLMNLLSSHDVERIRSVLDLGYEIRGLDRRDQHDLVAGISDDADAHGAALQAMLAAIVHTLPGVPCIYYGDERGMQGGRDPFDRASFPWSGDRADCGKDLTEAYRSLGALRRDSAALRTGDVAFYSHGRAIVAILRVAVTADGVDMAICVVNRSDAEMRLALDLVDPASGLSDEMVRVVRTIGGSRDDRGSVTLDDGIFVCTVPPLSATIYRNVDASMAPAFSTSEEGCVPQAEAQTDPLSATEALASENLSERSLAKPLSDGVGIICHVTSLPGHDGTDGPIAGGTFAAAYRFVDLLAEHGIRYWQVLPLNPTDEHGSPYAGLSAFAGNTRLMDGSAPEPAAADLDRYIEANAEWLLPYATFTAIKRVVGEVPWQEWPAPYHDWAPELFDDPALAPHIQEEIRHQYEFDRQWSVLRDYANARGVSIIGDMPMYVSVDSADVWAHRDRFALDECGYAALEGGMPPDRFAADGQLWGCPTYDWDTLKAHGYDWWLARFERMFHWYDHVRLDHFLGFSAYYAIPAGASAHEGSWLDGPGKDLFDRAHDRFGELPVVAEDLGIVTPAVEELLEQTGIAGMAVIQFADGDPLIHWEPKPNKIRYASTHDTQTVLGWIKDRYWVDGDEALNLVERVEDVLASARPADGSPDIVMYGLQDMLRLGDDARMNVPGTVGANWAWRASEEALFSDEISWPASCEGRG